MAANSNPTIGSYQLPTNHPFVGIDLPWLLRQRAESHSTKLFLAWEPFDGEAKHWSYAEAYEDITRLASGLASKGVTAGETVLIHADNSPESIFLWFACSMIGAVGVTSNPRCAGDELAYFAEKINAVGIVSQPEFENLVRDHLPNIGWSVIANPGDCVQLIGNDRPLPERPADPAHPFCVQFTSGTTSRPKAVVWTHANALWGAMINARHLGIRSNDTTLVYAPMCHTLAQAWQVLSTLWVGGSVVLQPKFSASRFWDAIVRNQCTWTVGGPFTILALGDTPVPENHQLRFVLGGLQLSPSDDPWGIRNFSAHGMTETITHTIFSDPTGPIEPGAIGRPATEYELAIVNSDGESVSPGETGELLVKGVRGISLLAEYFDDSKATAEAFTPEGFFRTGDLVSMQENGTIVFADRLKDMLKVGGENVAASEIEAIIRTVPGVSEVAIVGQPHKMLQEVPFAFIIPTDGAPANLAEKIIDACKTSLADFKVPRDVRLVDDFPRSTGGMKVKKVSLRQLLTEEAQ